MIKSRNLIITLLFGILFFIINFYCVFVSFQLDIKSIIGSDAEGYFQYLIYFFIKHDITHMPYAVSVDNGMTFDKYTCGVAILEIPFFFVGHIYNKIFGLVDEAHSTTYGMAILLAALTYVFIGLLLLYRILRKWFNKWSSLIAVLSVYFATNLFYFTVVAPGYSHAYSFFILTLFIYLLDKFLKKPNIINSIFCGFSLGIAVLIKPTNIFYALLFLLYGVNSFSALKNRVSWIIKNFRYFVIVALLIFIVFIPQMLYWHAVSGHYIVNAYEYTSSPKYVPGGQERFIYWNSPKIGYVLFGVQNGWLVYSPVFFLFLIGLAWMLVKKIDNAIGILFCFIFISYAIASWYCYTFSCAFGHRAFIEYYPLFIIPIAYLFSKVFIGKRNILVKGLMILLLFIFSFTNLRLSYFHFKDPCWERPSFTWVNFNKALNKAFYIIPQGRDIR